MNSYPKIWALGRSEVLDLFEDGVEIEVTEKVDGSQFAFGMDFDGVLKMRSKGAMIYDDANGGWLRELTPGDLFYPACNEVLDIVREDRLAPGTTYYAETLCKPKHSTLKYNRVPTGHMALFGAIVDKTNVALNWSALYVEASVLGIEVVPRLYFGNNLNNENVESFVEDWLKTESFLGGPKLEGVVFKKYKPYMLYDQVFPLMAAKYVSEEFKEVHKSWSSENTGQGKWELFKQGYRTEARWQKAVQYLQEQGELENDPRDIGKLIKRINTDILEEDEQVIRNFLYNLYHKDVLRVATAGFPEWYKKQIAFGGSDTHEVANGGALWSRIVREGRASVARRAMDKET